jgi:hypothetical protein
MSRWKLGKALGLGDTVLGKENLDTLTRIDNLEYFIARIGNHVLVCIAFRVQARI